MLTNQSYQIQDFFVQIASGQNALLAAAQQLPQMLGPLGMWGAIAATVTAIGGAIYMMTREASASEKILKDLNDQLSDLDDLARAGGDGVIELTDKLRQFETLGKEAFGTVVKAEVILLKNEMESLSLASEKVLENIGKSIKDVERFQRQKAGIKETTLKDREQDPFAGSKLFAFGDKPLDTTSKGISDYINTLAISDATQAKAAQSANELALQYDSATKKVKSLNDALAAGTAGPSDAEKDAAEKAADDAKRIAERAQREREALEKRVDAMDIASMRESDALKAQFDRDLKELDKYLKEYVGNRAEAEDKVARITRQKQEKLQEDLKKIQERADKEKYRDLDKDLARVQSQIAKKQKKTLKEEQDEQQEILDRGLAANRIARERHAEDTQALDDYYRDRKQQMDADAVYQTRAIQEDQFLMISDTVIRMTDLIEQAHGKNSGIAKAAFLISRTLQVVQQIMAARTAAAGVRASGYMLMGDPATVESRAQMVLMTGYANVAISAGMAIGELAARDRKSVV